MSKNNARSIENLERKLFDFFTLSQLGKSLISIENLDELARAFVSAVREHGDAATVGLLVYDFEEEVFTYAASFGLDVDAVKEVSFVEDTSLFWRAVKAGEPFSLQDPTVRRRFEESIEQNRLDLLEAQIWFPLVVKSSVRGLLALGARRDGKPYDERRIQFISQLAMQAAIAIDSAILDRQKQRATAALGKKMENLSVLYDVARAINFVNDLKKTLLLILDKSRLAVGAERGSIMLLNKETNELEVNVVRGIDAAIEKRINDGDLACMKIKLGEGIAGRVAETLEHMVVTDTRNDGRFKQADGSTVESLICLPLVADGACIGVLNISNTTAGGSFTDDEIELLLTLAGQISITINNAKLYHLAITDGLTQLYINRYFRLKLHDEMIRSRRYNHPVSLIMADIDDFKLVNDTMGHRQGDMVLAGVARILKRAVRETDLVCRYGGEEFAIVLPETSAANAGVAAENLRRLIEEAKLPALHGKPLRVTISVGVASFPADATTEDELVQAADNALYAAKAGGRNRVRFFEPSLPRHRVQHT
jgi:diguanylate cyclase (GGDEF)-like protein